MPVAKRHYESLFSPIPRANLFFIILGVSHWQTVLGLIVGGVVAAPIAARLAGKLPLKKMFIGVGVLVILSSLRIIWNSIEKLI